MQMRQWAVAVSMWLLPAIAEAEVRMWKDATGKFSVEAELVKVDGKNVELVSSQGKKITLPIAKLSKPDQALIKAWEPPVELPGGGPKLPPRTPLLLAFKVKAPNGQVGTTANVHAFAIHWPGEKRLIAITVLDPFVGLTTTPDKLAQTVLAVQISDAVSGKPLGQGAGIVPVAAAFGATPADMSAAMAAFWVDPKIKPGALSLAAELPPEKEKIWLLRLPTAENTEPPSMIPGTLRTSSEKTAIFDLDDAEEVTPFGGAPLLNAKGEVVGMYTAKGGASSGYVIPAVAIRAQIEKALGAAAKP